MPVVGKGPEIDKSAFIIVDMQNDFLHRDGSFSHIAREHPEFGIDMPFLIGTVPSVKRLAEAFRAQVVDATTEHFIFEITGRISKIENFISLMKPLGLVEVARTGAAAIARGAEPM